MQGQRGGFLSAPLLELNSLRIPWVQGAQEVKNMVLKRQAEWPQQKGNAQDKASQEESSQQQPGEVGCWLVMKHAFFPSIKHSFFFLIFGEWFFF